MLTFISNCFFLESDPEISSQLSDQIIKNITQIVLGKMEETLEVLSQIIPTPSKDQNVDENIPINEVQLPSINNIQNGGTEGADNTNVVSVQNVQNDKVQNGGFIPIETDVINEVLDEQTDDLIDNLKPIDSSNTNLDMAEGRVVLVLIKTYH